MSAVAQTIASPNGPAKVLLAFEFDWKRPNYQRVFHHRLRWLAHLQKPENAHQLRSLLKYYRENGAQGCAQFIADWGCTFDPRNPERGLPSTVPFIPFPKQVAWIEWMLSRWRSSEPGLTEKSRDCGVSWLAMAVSCWAGLFHRGIAVGFGSAKADKVDRSDDPDCLFFKGRFFLSRLPVEFRGGWNEAKDSAYMRIVFRRTLSSITGEAGDEIGRGGRKSWYFVDEAAHLQHPKMVDDSMSSCTNCRLDLSSVNGMANPFAVKRHKWPKERVFTFHWRDDPRKDDAWYAQQIKDAADPIVVAQNIDIDYFASQQGQLIPAIWVNAAVGAAEKVGYKPTGIKRLGLDVADEGKDLNAAAGRHGSLLNFLESWHGKGSDTYLTTVRACALCEDRGYEGLDYDADGMGAFVRGDTNKINEDRLAEGRQQVMAEPFRGSASGEGLFEPDSQAPDTERVNKDYFANLKAQSWVALKIRFRNTYRWVVEGLEQDTDECIFIPADLPELPELLIELMQPAYKLNSAGKLLIDKAPDGAASPNRADAVMIAFNPTAGALGVWAKLGAAR